MPGIHPQDIVKIASPTPLLLYVRSPEGFAPWLSFVPFSPFIPSWFSLASPLFLVLLSLQNINANINVCPSFQPQNDQMSGETSVPGPPGHPLDVSGSVQFPGTSPSLASYLLEMKDVTSSSIFVLEKVFSPPPTPGDIPWVRGRPHSSSLTLNWWWLTMMAGDIAGHLWL